MGPQGRSGRLRKVLSSTGIRSPDRVTIPTELSRHTIRRNYNNIKGKLGKIRILYKTIQPEIITLLHHRRNNNNNNINNNNIYILFSRIII